MRKSFDEAIKCKKLLIAAHRGVYGGNIIENTLESSLIAFNSGADILEIDVIKSKDDVLFCFHSGEEEKKFNNKIKLSSMLSEDIEKLEYLNNLGETSGKRIEKLEYVLKNLKGKGFINIDRAWKYFDKVFEIVEKLNMEDQIIIKSEIKNEYIDFLENHKLKLMYMPIVKKAEEINKIIDKDINIVAAELLVFNENDYILSKEYISYLKNKNIHIWLNAINLNNKEKSRFHAGYSDDLSLMNDGKGWEFLYQSGAEIIQTDWVHFLYKFRKEKING